MEGYLGEHLECLQCENCRKTKWAVQLQLKMQLLTAQFIVQFSKCIVYLTNIKTEDTIVAAIVYFCT